MVNIKIVLSEPSIRQSGGYKMVYYYANALTEAGHNVEIIYRKYSIVNNFIVNSLDNIARIYIMHHEPSWFELNYNIRKKFRLQLKEQDLRNADVIIATTVDTIYEIKKIVNEKKIVYFIQDFENWNRTNDYVTNSYRNRSIKIVISKWLKEIVDNFSETKSIYIANGIDCHIFNLITSDSIEKRNPHKVAMLYHTQPRKNTQLGLEILREIKKNVVDLEVNIFGTSKRPNDLPEWFHYTEKASPKQLRSIYNESSIFLCTSNIEGYGLTGLEAMACGCALVTTDCKGVLEYAMHNQNALVCKINDKQALKKSVSTLLYDQDKRLSLAHNAYKTARNYSIDTGKTKFVKVLESMLSNDSDKTLRIY